MKFFVFSFKRPFWKIYVNYNMFLAFNWRVSSIFLVSSKRKNVFLNFLVADLDETEQVSSLSTKLISKIYFGTLKYHNSSYKLTFILIRLFQRLNKQNMIFLMYNWSSFASHFYQFSFRFIFFIDLIFIPRESFSYKKYKKFRSIKKKIRKKVYFRKVNFKKIR